MELNAFLGSDAALLLFSGLGLVATGLAIMRDIPVQRRVVEQPIPLNGARSGLAQPGPTVRAGASR
ncbi:MAG TPA: hypothetical protein VIN70_03635 [Candidatus Limnocylindria bacterium]